MGQVLQRTRQQENLIHPALFNFSAVDDGGPEVAGDIDGPGRNHGRTPGNAAQQSKIVPVKDIAALLDDLCGKFLDHCGGVRIQAKRALGVWWRIYEIHDSPEQAGIRQASVVGAHGSEVFVQLLQIGIHRCADQNYGRIEGINDFVVDGDGLLGFCGGDETFDNDHIRPLGGLVKNGKDLLHQVIDFPGSGHDLGPVKVQWLGRVQVGGVSNQLGGPLGTCIADKELGDGFAESNSNPYSVEGSDQSQAYRGQSDPVPQRG